MRMFNLFEGTMVIIVAPLAMLVAPSCLGTTENQTVRLPMTNNENSAQGAIPQSSEKEKVDLFRDILASEKEYTEKVKAAESLGVMQSQLAASALLENLMSVRSGVRKGPQMRPVIGMYPCAIALVENGTNSIPPVIEYLQRTEREETRYICMEILKCIQRGFFAMELIQKRLRTKMAKEERVRLESTLKYLLQDTENGPER